MSYENEAARLFVDYADSLYWCFVLALIAWWSKDK